MQSHLHARYALFVTLLSICVVLLGAYVRLSDAGLGCPDWPGCYGQLSAPATASELARASEAFPGQAVDTAKAHKEMLHRYLAGLLGISILLLMLLAWRQRDGNHGYRVPALLVGLVIFQALLGMWTVTLQVKPLIVVAHLLGGFTITALLWLHYLQLSEQPLGRCFEPDRRRLITLSTIGLFVLLLQITLGGWTSSHYAAIGCIDFPSCNGGQWWPEMDFAAAFSLHQPSGINYEFGILSPQARTAIHISHRLGALLTLVVLGGLAIYLLKTTLSYRVYRLGWLLLAMLLLQIALGISNVLASLPLPIALAHNGGALLLLLLMVTLLRRLYRCNNLKP